VQPAAVGGGERCLVGADAARSSSVTSPTLSTAGSAADTAGR
jgi:hypothetical protein